MAVSPRSSAATCRALPDGVRDRRRLAACRSTSRCCTNAISARCAAGPTTACVRPADLDRCPARRRIGGDFRARVAEAFARIVALRAGLDGNLAVVTHGLVIGAILETHARLAAHDALPERLGNASLTVLVGGAAARRRAARLHPPPRRRCTRRRAQPVGRLSSDRRRHLGQARSAQRPSLLGGAPVGHAASADAPSTSASPSGAGAAARRRRRAGSSASAVAGPCARSAVDDLGLALQAVRDDRIRSRAAARPSGSRGRARAIRGPRASSARSEAR